MKIIKRSLLACSVIVALSTTALPISAASSPKKAANIEATTAKGSTPDATSEYATLTAAINEFKSNCFKLNQQQKSIDNTNRIYANPDCPYNPENITSSSDTTDTVTADTPTADTSANTNTVTGCIYGNSYCDGSGCANGNGICDGSGSGSGSASGSGSGSGSAYGNSHGSGSHVGRGSGSHNGGGGHHRR